MDYFSQAVKAALNLIFSFDKDVYFIVWTSVRISLVAVIIASIIGIPLGLTVSSRSFFGKRFLLHLLNTAMALPTVVVGLVLYGLFTRKGPMGEWDLLYTPAAIMIGQAILILPVIWNLTISAAGSADPRLINTCKSLGANQLQLGIIYLSEVRFALMAAVVTGFGRAIGEVGVAMMLGGNIEGFTRTMTTAIALETGKGEFEFALALGILLLLVAFLVNFLLQRFQYLHK